MSGSEKIGEFITIEREGRVAVLRFDRGNRVNALSVQLLRDLGAAQKDYTKAVTEITASQ